MDGSYFQIDLKAFILAGLCCVPFFFLWRWRQGFSAPHLLYSDLASLVKGAGKVRWAGWPQRLFWMALMSFLLAFIDPHLLVERENKESRPPPTEGVAIYLVLDQSGSMKEPVIATTSSGQRFLSKIDLVKEVTEKFINGDSRHGLRGRSNDMIGLIFFARGASVKTPLTLDHAAVLKALSTFNPVENKDQDGTSIGYAIYKAATMLAANRHYSQELAGKGQPAYIINSNIIILLTDGLQDPNPLDKGKRLRNMDVPEAAAYAKSLGVRLYMVNVEPSLNTEEFAPYRHIMQRAAELTGGKFYMVDSTSNLQQIYTDIDQLEKSLLPPPEGYFDREKRPDLYQRLSFYPYLIAFGLVCLLLAAVLETTFLRRVP